MSWSGWAREASVLHDAREYDAIVASGEQVTFGFVGDCAAGLGYQCPLLAGLANSDQDRWCAWRGADFGH